MVMNFAMCVVFAFGERGKFCIGITSEMNAESSVKGWRYISSAGNRRFRGVLIHEKVVLSGRVKRLISRILSTVIIKED